VTCSKTRSCGPFGAAWCNDFGISNGALQIGAELDGVESMPRSNRAGKPHWPFARAIDRFIAGAFRRPNSADLPLLFAFLHAELLICLLIIDQHDN
jgi:hypothetical protein